MPIDQFWKIHVASCEQCSTDYPENTFKVVVSSPPYKKKDGYSDELLKTLAANLYKVTAESGLCFINFASLVESWGRPFDVYDFFIQAGWKPVTTIIWVKSMVFPGLCDLPGTLGSEVEETISILESIRDSDLVHEFDGKSNLNRKIEALLKLLTPRQVGHYTPIDDERRMNNLFEYIHVFAKGDLPDLDRFTQPLGVPYADKSNLKRGNRGKHGDTHCAGNVWFIPYSTRSGPKSAHPHEYPLELVRRCLILAKAKPGDVLLDPFCGGGSTVIAAKDYGISGVAYEIDSNTASLAEKRIANHNTQVLEN